MLKLIKLEYKKHGISKYVRNALIMSGVILVFLFAFVYLGIANDPDTGVPDAAVGATGASATVELITSISYMIFATVMHSSFTISTYKNHTMNLMFSYPIKRKLIIIAQMTAVWIFNVVALILTKLIAYGTILLGSQFLNPVFSIDYNFLSIDFYLILLLKSIMTVSIIAIALYVGLVVKSSKAAIVASFLLVILMQGNIGGVSLSDNVLLPVILTVVSLIFALLSVLNIETKDI